jgi:DNA-binding protein HU-beta
MIMQKLKNLNHMALADAVAKESGVDRATVERVLRATFDVIGRTVIAGFKVTVTNFGTWHSHVLPGRTVRNPQTGETKDAPSARYPRFLYSPKIRRASVSGEFLETLKKRGH